jgi:ribonuclease I
MCKLIKIIEKRRFKILDKKISSRNFFKKFQKQNRKDTKARLTNKLDENTLEKLENGFEQTQKTHRSIQIIPIFL